MIIVITGLKTTWHNPHHQLREHHKQLFFIHDIKGELFWQMKHLPNF